MQLFNDLQKQCAQCTYLQNKLTSTFNFWWFIFQYSCELWSWWTKNIGFGINNHFDILKLILCFNFFYEIPFEKFFSSTIYKHFLCERIHKPIFIFTFGRADSLSVRCICFFFNYIWCVAIFFKLFLLLIIVKVNF